MRRLDRKQKKIILTLLILFLIGFIYYKFKFIREIAVALLLSFIIAYTLKPICKLITRKTNLNKRFVAAFILSMIAIIFVALIAIIIPKMLSESLNISDIIDTLENFIVLAQNKVKLSDSELFTTLSSQFSERINRMISGYSLRVIDGLIAFGENIIALAVVPVVSYYFLTDGDLISNKFMGFIPINKRAVIREFGKDIDKILGKYVLGQLILCLVVGVMTFVFMFFLDIKFPLIIALLNAVLNVVPYFGAVIGAVPAIMIALLDGPMKAIWVVIAFIIIQQIESDLIAPQVMSSTISIHPLMIIVLLLIGEKIGGLVGMVLIVPIAVVLKVLYEDINYYLF